MNKINVSAPGKLMLMGEHAVVYNHPCIVTTVDQRIYLGAELLVSLEFQLDAEDVGVIGYKKSISDLGKGKIPKGAKFVEIAVKNVYKEYSLKSGLKISTKSDFSSSFGFGSSSASTVCVIKTISELFGLKLSEKDIFDISYKTVLEIQGKGSGFDIAASVYGGTLYFRTGGKVIEKLEVSSLPLIVGYSGVKADTVTLIEKVRKSFEGKQDYLDRVYTEIDKLVEKGKKTLVNTDWEDFGILMNKNQELLNELGVSIEKLDNMIDASINAGAFGAKLSGAGGGDCMIALSDQKKIENIKKAIVDVGGEIIDIKTGAEGVRID